MKWAISSQVLNYKDKDLHKLNLSKSHKNNDLPMYMVYIKERPLYRQSEGYCIANHPKSKSKYFTGKYLSLEDKYKLAKEYLDSLNSL